MKLETDLVHAGEPHPRIEGAAQAPLFLATVWEHTEEAGYDDIRYPRLNNLPNHRLLAEKLAAVEGAQDALVTASGMAAISTTLLAVLGQGGHLLAQAGLYGGTHTLLTEELPRLGLAVTFVDGDDPAAWRAALRPETRAIYTEGISNPLCRVADHEAVVRFAREHELLSLVDNTFATPVAFRPIPLGYDLVLHSATKYLNGHSDLVAGAVAGTHERVEQVRHALNHLGGCLDPFGCFLFTRGMKTLALRVRHQSASALRLARFLEGHPAVARVRYPGLESHPDHARARSLFQGFGAMLSFELEGGAEAAAHLVRAVRIATHGPSLGGPETLVIRPATSSHRGVAPEELARMGISEGLVRLSVGIEHPDDLEADLARALR